MGSLVRIGKLLAARNACTQSEYASSVIIMVVLPLSACMGISFSVTSLFLNCFIVCSCLFLCDVIVASLIDDLF